MKDRVVCIERSWRADPSARNIVYPVYGEIYTSLPSPRGEEWTIIEECGNDNSYLRRCFRPVDDTFGDVIAETIEEQIQLEEIIKI